MTEEIWVTVDDGRPVEEWADCAVPGCPNKRCARLASQFCYPHSNRPEDGIMKQVDDMTEQREPVETTVRANEHKCWAWSSGLSGPPVCNHCGKEKVTGQAER